LIACLAGRARASGLALTGEDGLLAQLTKRLVESALEGEITDHLGYDRHDATGRDGGNSRNGHRSKTVLTEVGPVQIDVPRDREATFEPRIVGKRKRRLSGVWVWQGAALLVQPTAHGKPARWPVGRGAAV
jgi:transposase-like protein